MSELSRSSRPVARVEHLCNTCGRCIRRGERYFRWSGTDMGVFVSYLECGHCSLAARVWDLGDHDGHYDEDFNEWEPGTIAGLRAKVYFGKRWTRPDGTLYEVPLPATELAGAL